MKLISFFAVVMMMVACSGNKSEELNALLETKINAQFANENRGLKVREVRTVQKHDNEYKGVVEVKDDKGNLQSYELDATYDGHDAVYEIYGLNKSESSEVLVVHEQPAKPKPAPQPVKSQPAVNAWQGSFNIQTRIFDATASLILEIHGNNVSGYYTASNYPSDYLATVTGSINGNQMSLQTHEPGSKQVIRWMNGTIQNDAFVASYRTKSGGTIGTFTWR